MKNVAIILAGGVGRRTGLSIPKQFLKMAGRTIIEHSVEAFEHHENIDEIAIVVNPMFFHRVEEMIAKNHWKKVKKVLNGGNERYESSLSAIRAYEKDAEKVNLIFHDAVRPLVSARIITDVCALLQEKKAVDVVVPAVDTIVEVSDAKGVIKNIPNREYLRRGQTPQGFRLSVIKEAYEKALLDPNFQATDDCGIVVKYTPEIKVDLVYGEECNVKLTNPEDIYLLDKLFQLKSTNPGDIPFSQLKGKVLVVFGGSSGIGKDIAEMAKENGAIVFVYSRSEGHVDVSNLENVKEALDKVYIETKRIDYIVNSAAILNKEPILHLDQSAIRQIVDVNYIGVVNTTLASYPYLKESKGQILQFTSSSYTRGRAYYAMYSSTKCAIVNFVQSISEEWESYGIKINCINPERTKTPMRIRNFGVEDESTLLKSKDVAKMALKTLLNKFTGEVVDVRLNSFKQGF